MLHDRYTVRTYSMCVFTDVCTYVHTYEFKVEGWSTHAIFEELELLYRYYQTILLPPLLLIYLIEIFMKPV